ncbi:MAG: response regulator [Deltaproteobacteria bacterium]|nr:response regulator [Deltaproteobacteria bacterium]
MNQNAQPDRAKILIVDDNPVNVSLLERILRHEYDLRSAYDGSVALKLIAEQLPDLILLDVMMPGMTGFEVMQILKDDPVTADIPVIFITALDEGKNEAQGLDLGAVDYIHKPFDIILTRLRIRNQIELKQQRNLLKAQKMALEETLSRVKLLEGIISICMYCKQIRNDQQTWQQLEQYISEHSEAKFSHGICPACAEIHFSQYHLEDHAGQGKK